MSINKVIVAGRLTRDGELKQTQTGMNLLNFCVAVNDFRVDSETGQRNDYANFFDCTMFGERAVKLAPYLTMGMKVVVEGKLHYNVWQTKEGDKRSRITITVHDVELMSKSTDKPLQENAPVPMSASTQASYDNTSQSQLNQANTQNANNPQQQAQIAYEGYDYSQQSYSNEIPF